jgi:Eco29kI restriction endonuclease
MSTNFNPELHTFRLLGLKSVVKEALNFFEGTAVHKLPPPERFYGAGIYALYYIGEYELYKPIAERNKDEIICPIYVGKAVPPGSRTGFDVSEDETEDLLGRLGEHKKSLMQAGNLNPNDFRCRFMIMLGNEADLIVPVEMAVIRKFKPLWNAKLLHGFGNHDPGAGRYKQRRSRWDILHEGRSWAARMEKLAASREDIINDVRDFFDKLASGQPVSGKPAPKKRASKKQSVPKLPLP